VTSQDFYGSVDLLADVFPGTENAPTPMSRKDAGRNLLSLWPSPEDPRWSVWMTFYPNGDLMAVHWVKPRSE
jgi:hypothetical protein